MNRKLLSICKSKHRKSTLLKSYSIDFLTIKELKGDKNSISGLYYELSTKEDGCRINLFILSLLDKRFIGDSSIGEDVIFDYLVDIFEDIMNTIKQYPEYIISKTSAQNFKKDFKKRKRK